MLWLIGLTVLAFYCTVIYKSQSFNKKTFEAGKTPSIVMVLLKILLRILSRRQGQLYHVSVQRGSAGVQNEGKQPTDDMCHIAPGDDEVVIITNYRVTSDFVAQYNRVCCENNDNSKVPFCFPECLFMHNLLLLVCRQSFKLSPLGLIHIGQTITLHEDLQQLLDAPCSLEAQTVEYRSVSRGIEVDISVKVRAASGRCIWSGVATLLSRSQRAQSSGAVASYSRLKDEDADWDRADRCIKKQKIEVPSDIGVRYARLSMDWNPHHLYPWSARLLGYRAPIAHGLWTLAKTIALITGMEDGQTKFTQVNGRFKRPLFLPGVAILEYYTDDNSCSVQFRVIDAKTRAPHLVGSIS